MANLKRLEKQWMSLEKRVIALEKAVQELQELRIRANGSSLPAREEEVIPDTECYFVPAKPPEKTIHCQAVIKVIDEAGSGELGLSDAEWDNVRFLMELEEEKEVNP